MTKEATTLARSEEFRRLSIAGAGLARALNASPVAEAAAALARSEEFRRLSIAGAGLARALNASPVAEAAAALARSEEFRRLSIAGAGLARALNASPVAEAVAALARSEEFRRLSIAGAGLARALNASPVAEAVAALAHSAKAFENSPLTIKSPLSSDYLVPNKGASPNIVVDPIDDDLGDTNPGEWGDLGDCKNDALKTNFKPGLQALARAKCKRVEVSVGFKLSFASVPVPTVVESCAVDTAFNPQHSQILYELEQSLRQLVERSLEGLAGSNWLRQRIPQNVRERWEERQGGDRTEGRPVYSAVQYANFMDLADVITRRDNWHEVFHVIFQDPNDIRESLRRLHPIRKAIAHSRPLCRDDVLTLISEATRIYRAMGVRVLH